MPEAKDGNVLRLVNPWVRHGLHDYKLSFRVMLVNPRIIPRNERSWASTWRFCRFHFQKMPYRAYYTGAQVHCFPASSTELLPKTAQRLILGMHHLTGLNELNEDRSESPSACCTFQQIYRLYYCVLDVMKMMKSEKMLRRPGAS